MDYRFIPVWLLEELPDSRHLLITSVFASDVETLLPDLTPEDAREAEELAGASAAEAILGSLKVADWSLALRSPSGRLLAIGGLRRDADGDGSPWLVHSVHLRDEPLETRLAYLELARAMVAALLRRYPNLCNLVTDGNERAIQLLGWLGAKFGPEVGWMTRRGEVAARHFFFMREDVNHVH